MAENKLTMFGKTYNTVGSADSNLLLQTRGDLKIRWGNTFIDLIKNGKINAENDFIKKVNSKESIAKDGIYYILNGENKEVWLSVGGELISLILEEKEQVNDYVSYKNKQKLSKDEQFLAMSNLGFYYDTYADLVASDKTKGIYYVLSDNKFYYISNHKAEEYKPNFIVPDPLQITDITINGSKRIINSVSELYFYVDYSNKLEINFDNIIVNTPVICTSSIKSNNYTSDKGYSIYFNDNESVAHFDKIIVRKFIEYNNKHYVTYSELQELISSENLIEGHQYIITDFNNIYGKKTIRIILKAFNSNTLEKLGYILDNPQWIIEYDPFYKYIISYNEVLTKYFDENNLEQTVTSYTPVYSKGRITKMTDEFGNQANFDFKHSTFNGKYLFNNTVDNVNKDASLTGNITNNIIYLKEPTLIESIINPGELEIVSNDYIIFDGIEPNNNTINLVIGTYTISNDFNKNYIDVLLDSTISGIIENCQFTKVINCDFSSTSILLKCVFNDDIENCNISGRILNCKFLKLTAEEGYLQIDGTLSDINILVDLSPDAASYVESATLFGDYIVNSPFVLSTNTVPKLQLSDNKTCFILTIDDKVVFIVKSDNDITLPKGIISMFSGSQIPEGWAICDGTNGTPDLRGRFIRMTDTGEDVGPIDNDDLVTNGAGTRQAYINKSIAHTHFYNSSATIDYSGLTIDYNGGNLINGYTEDSTVEVYKISTTGTDTTYAEGAESTYVKEGLENQGLHNHEYNITLPSIEVSGDITASITVTLDTEAEASDFVTAINVEPLAYALIFIMKL